jgi:hypothetical protein
MHVVRNKERFFKIQTIVRSILKVRPFEEVERTKEKKEARKAARLEPADGAKNNTGEDRPPFLLRNNSGRKRDGFM